MLNSRRFRFFFSHSFPQNVAQFCLVILSLPAHLLYSCKNSGSVKANWRLFTFRFLNAQSTPLSESVSFSHPWFQSWIVFDLIILQHLPIYTCLHPPTPLFSVLRESMHFHSVFVAHHFERWGSWQFTPFAGPSLSARLTLDLLVVVIVCISLFTSSSIWPSCPAAC